MTINKVSNIRQLVLLISQNDQTVYHIQHTRKYRYLRHHTIHAPENLNFFYSQVMSVI